MLERTPARSWNVITDLKDNLNRESDQVTGQGNLNNQGEVPDPRISTITNEGDLDK